MQSERWVRLERLFGEALELPGAERAAFLQRSCAADAELLVEVEALIRAHDAPGVLDVGPLGAEAAMPQPSLPAGTRLGAWRIEEMIGRGGMGEVYAASRADAAYQQRAALKLLRYEAAAEMERFHAERRILARLEHPGIARILDGGMAADGRPYTVMEYVEGKSLTDYCREQKCSLRERLALFGRICDAVAFAHRNLVIHRDLKPANILVDAAGDVKLLDFGIAKLIDATATPRDAAITIAPFTPEYAAPEQLGAEAVTTATDIYALGLLLFELLTGDRPMRVSALIPVQALKLMLERDAPSPSSMARVNADAPVPPRLLTGDLDAIVAKCLRREPTHRYETATALRRDVERHLRAEPVIAREGARMYVVGRMLRRYRWAVAAITALVLALAGGLAGTVWQARRAETQARTSFAVQTFLGDLFRTNTSRQDDPVKARQTSARELLDLGAKKIDTSMADAPEAKLGVLKLLGQLYDDLSLDDESVRLRQQAVDLARALYGPDSIEVADALLDLAGSMHYTKSAPAEREKLLVDATAILDRRGDSTSETRGVLLQKLAEHYFSSDAPKALDYASRAVRLFEARPASGGLAESLFERGLAEHNLGSDRESVASLIRATEVSRAADGYPNPNLPRYYANLGQYQYRVQDIAGAEKSTRLALQLAIAVNGEDHVDTLQTEMRLGRILFDSGNTEEGLKLLQSASQRALRIRGADDPNHTPLTLTEYGSAQVRMGLLEAGLVDLEAAIANRRTHSAGSTYLATVLELAASGLIEVGRSADATADLDEASAIKLKSGIKPRTSRSNFNTSTRIRLALAQGDRETARSLLGELFVETDAPPGLSFNAIEKGLLEAEVDLASEQNRPAAELARRVRQDVARSGLEPYLGSIVMRAELIEGQAELLDRHAADALPLLRQSLALREKLLDGSSPKIADAQIALAQCYVALGQTQQAQALEAAAVAIHARHKELGEQYRRPLRALQAQLGMKTSG